MNLLKIALNEYKNWKKTDAFGEEYKYDILKELNTYFQGVAIDSDNVLSIAKKLNQMNPSEGALVHWSNLNDLVKYAEAAKEQLVDELNLLLKSSDPIDERIKRFREKASEVSKDYTFGTPFFGYIFAAYDMTNYTPFKDGDFSNYCQLLLIDKETSISKKYLQQLEIVNELNNYNEIESILDAQSFLHVLNQDQFKFKVLIKYLSKMSKELDQLMSNEELFFKYVNELSNEELNKISEHYKNSEKINGIRHEFANQVIEASNTNVKDIENIYNNAVEKIASKYNTNIMQSWGFSNILFPFYYEKHKKFVKKYLKDISEIIIKSLKIDQKLIESSENDFLWNHGFGNSAAWIAIYPKKNKSHKEAIQLHLGILPTGIEIGLMNGSNNALKINETEIIESIESLTLENIIGKFNSQLKKFNKLNDMINYFWISANPNIWEVKENLGKSVIYKAYNEEGNKRRVFKNFEKAKRGDQVIIYESSPTQKIVAKSEIKNSLEDVKDQNGVEIKIDEELINGLTWEEIIKHPELKNSTVVNNKAQGTLFEISKQEYEILCNEKTKETPQEISVGNPGEVKVDFEKKFKFNDTALVFETGILEALESQISIALRNGKNIILVGPPGTGKSKLGKEICNHYRKSEYNLITANSDWSTFDTIGGYKPQKDGSLKFQPGLFLKQFKNNEMNINRWLIIDEINRADIDKAFGAFFSALAGDQVNLSFEDENGENIVITNDETDHKNHHYLIHNDWRLIATMNTLDKTSLYEMSYAFMRRFAFISVPSPRNISNELIHRYLSVWNIENKDYVEDIKKVWQLINNYRKIGPALIEDFYKYLVASQGDYASAINMFVIPQLEGVYDDKIIELRDKLSEFDFINEKDMLKDFINNFFMLEE